MDVLIPHVFHDYRSQEILRDSLWLKCDIIKHYRLIVDCIPPFAKSLSECPGHFNKLLFFFALEIILLLFKWFTKNQVRNTFQIIRIYTNLLSPSWFSHTFKTSILRKCKVYLLGKFFRMSPFPCVPFGPPPLTFWMFTRSKFGCPTRWS